jgi:hypothetical protein
MRYTIRPLDASTWAAFAELVERNNRIFGGCWCMGYHSEVSLTDAAQSTPRVTGARTQTFGMPMTLRQGRWLPSRARTALCTAGPSCR